MPPQEPTDPMLNKKLKVKVFKVKLVKDAAHFSVWQLAIFVVVFGGIGTYILLRSFAASPVLATAQAEQMTLPAGATSITDSAASGGQAVQMTKGGTSLTSQVTLPNTATSLNLIARGVKCHSGWPQISIQVDSNTVLPLTTVSSASWHSYSANVSLTAATHTLKITYSNANSCGRYLFLDVTNFYGAEVTVPTVSLGASPTSVAAGSASTLTWSSTNTTSCTASGNWSGTEPTSGSVSTGALSSNATYNLSCTGAGGTANASAVVTVTNSSPSSSIYWGARMDGDVYSTGSGDAPWTASTWNSFESHAGKKVSIVHFGQPAPWTQAFDASPFNLTISRGAIPLVSMNSASIPLTDITNGTYDSSITAWAKSAKVWGHPFMLRWDWEMNGTWFSWGAQAKSSPANYINAWRHVHDLFVAAGATNVTWVWCVNTEFSGSTPITQLYPGDSYVDWTSIDGYNWGTNPLKPNVWQTFSQVMAPTYSVLTQNYPTKPIIVSETASSEYGGSKATWITDALSSQLPTNFPKIKALVWFNWNIVQGSGRLDWPIESSSSAQSAFSAAIANSYYAANNYGSLPLLTKVAPL